MIRRSTKSTPMRPGQRNVAVIANPAREKPLSFAKLAERLEISRATIWRWTTRGSLGVVLETMQFGGRRVTTEEAYVRFCRGQQAAAARGHSIGDGEEASSVAELDAAPAKPLSAESRAKLAAVGLM